MSTADYCAYYQHQLGGQTGGAIGGQMRVFRGGLQSGAGLGDVLRGLFRFLAPIALRGLSTFANSTLTAHQAGIPLALAAKGAILPTLSAVSGQSAPSVSRFMNAVMPNLLGPTEVKPSGEEHPTKQAGGGGVLFDGVDGIPDTKKGLEEYKRGASTAVAKVRGSKRSASQKRKQPAKTVSYNF